MNKNIFTLINDSKIKINILQLLKNQKSINDRFPNPYRNDRYGVIYDTMSMQIIEEVGEYKDELYCNSSLRIYQSDASLSEFLDVIMYFGSTLVETFVKFNIDVDEFFDNNPNFKEIIIEDNYVLNNISMNINKKNGVMYEAPIYTDHIAYTRRKIADRKYHKDPKPVDANYPEEIIKSIIGNTLFPSKCIKVNNESIYNNKYRLPEHLNNLYPVLMDIFFCYDGGNVKTNSERINNIPKRINTLNNLINDKQVYVSTSTDEVFIDVKNE